MTPPVPLQLPTDDDALGWVEARTEDGLARARELVDGLKAVDSPEALEVLRRWDEVSLVLSNVGALSSLLSNVHPLEPVGRERHGTSRRWRFADGQGEIGFISPVSEPFCGDCNRIRLTAEGMLRTCLFSLTETDLRAPLRAGATDAELEETVRAAVWRKELKHHVNDAGFVQPERTMSRIGG